ncbi:hypothetical protein HW561_03095 [Rhodobacteraceae bacterium B1Z28]|uniref:PH (Pleckstrin Homology) domain-containing protein n=1 Tax=Ruegeria haliotis TaxID=2747601 RepID=A0ABX2PMG6_9RHOB|nr:hypothetical protein [Ruegeria haliotis]NVO54772.1 hypothetical protein [Ruegeria haliotis]
MQDEVLATVQASSARRWAGVGMLTSIGALVIYVALASPPELAWQLFLYVVGGVAFWLAHRMWHATNDRIELTRLELRTGSGRVIARVADIEAIDRGVFAFKPSNGFLVRTGTKGANSWAPGLWWRLGHRVGVGGVTAAAETKFMSEMLSAMLAERAGL